MPVELLKLFTIDGREYNYSRPKLKLWLQLDELNLEIRKAITKKDFLSMSALICKYLVTAFSDSNLEDWQNCTWKDTVSIFTEVLLFSTPDLDIPLSNSNKNKIEKVVWDYPGRSWANWANMFAKSYGWTLEYIAELDVEEAFKLMQELLLDDQMDKEWSWALSEISYQYDEVTKKSTFKPLSRPYWMLPTPEAPKKVKILSILMPVGNVIDLSKMGYKNESGRD